MIIPFSYDRTGFPLLHLIDLGCYMHLLPVAKVQFEAYALDHEYTKTLYEKACESNPLDREAAAHTLRLENHLMTGLLPDEAAHFAEWITEAEEPDAVFSLPQVSTWRRIYEALQFELCHPLIDHIIEDCPNPNVRELVHQIIETRKPHNLQELTLMRLGIIEWVRDGNTWGGLGAPHASFFPNTFEPLRDVFTPIDQERRMREFGFRLIRTFR